ncbi:MAG TPA: AAA family ATPase [Steroidobacteraceae bacterium]
MSPAPRLLLVTGAPASGKSRLAARLAQHYGACRCSKDEIKELLFDALGERDAQWSRRLSDASFALLFAYAPRLLSTRQLLLLEGNFRPGQHEAALAGVLAGAAAAQILCRAEAAIRAARLAARAADPGRHPGHRDRDIEPVAADAGFLDLPGPRWVFSSDVGGDGQWQALCRDIDGWRSG